MKLAGLDFFSDVLPLIFSLIAVVAILYFCYVFSKYIAKKANRAADSTNIHVLEKVALAQDKGLALAKICGKHYLIGFSNSSVEILAEVSSDDLKAPPPDGSGNFLAVFNSVMKNRLDVKTLGKNNARPDAGNSGEDQKKE